jgi:hypothetical protein
VLLIFILAVLRTEDSCFHVICVHTLFLTVERPLALSPAVTDTQLSLLGAASLRGNPRFRILYLHGWKQSATKFKNLTKQLRRKLEPLAGKSASYYNNRERFGLCYTPSEGSMQCGCRHSVEAPQQ